MTDREAKIRRAIVRVQNAFPSGTGSWAKVRFEEWVNAVIELEAAAVTTAVTDLIREWSSDYGRPPMPGHLYERALSIQRRHRADQQILRAADRSDVAPAWYARFVMATVIRSARLRGDEAPCPVRTVPYLAIVDQYELTPKDMSDLPPRTNDQRILDAHAEAQRYAEEIDDLRPSDVRELRELVGAGARAVDDEPFPRGPLNGGSR